MKKRSKVQHKLEQNNLSGTLIHMWKEITTLPKPRSLDRYMSYMWKVSRLYRGIANAFFEELKKNVYDTVGTLEGIEENLSWLTEITGSFSEECRRSYILTRRQKRSLQHLLYKSEEVWDRFSRHLRRARDGNKALKYERIGDTLDKGAPCTKGFYIRAKDLSFFTTN